MTIDDFALNPIAFLGVWRRSSAAPVKSQHVEVISSALRQSLCVRKIGFGNRRIAIKSAIADPPRNRCYAALISGMIEKIEIT
jgi:hypothetical protein